MTKEIIYHFFEQKDGADFGVDFTDNPKGIITAVAPPVSCKEPLEYAKLVLGKQYEPS